jgi:hypothetical protein
LNLSGRFSPDSWARVAVNAYKQYNADRIVAEGNQGGELGESHRFRPETTVFMVGMTPQGPKLHLAVGYRLTAVNMPPCGEYQLRLETGVSIADLPPLSTATTPRRSRSSKVTVRGERGKHRES